MGGFSKTPQSQPIVTFQVRKVRTLSPNVPSCSDTLSTQGTDGLGGRTEGGRGWSL